MPRGPAAAPMHRVKFALRPTGDAVCAELLAELRSSDKVAAEQAARGLKKNLRSGRRTAVRMA